MGDLLILNGSPRAPRSNSRRYAALAAGHWTSGSAVCRDILGADPAVLRGELERAAHVLLVFPLYADALPLPLLKFLIALEEEPPRNRPTVSVLVNCGFLEPHQNDVAVDMVRLFCSRNGYPVGSVLKIGSGEAILDTPFRLLAAWQIRRLVRSMVRGTHRPFSAAMPLTRRQFVAASTAYWLRAGRRNGITRSQMEAMEIEADPAAARRSPRADN